GALHHFRNFRRDYRSGVAGHAGKFLCGNFSARRSAFSSRRRHRGRPTETYWRGRRNYLARDKLNARLVSFSTIYTDSPAKTIHVVREAVRDADNVTDKIKPIVRIRGL